MNFSGRPNHVNFSILYSRRWTFQPTRNRTPPRRRGTSFIPEHRAKAEGEIKIQNLAVRPGGIEVNVPNALTADGRTFTVSLDGADPPVPVETVVGSTQWSKVAVPPGQYKVVVRSKRSGADVQGSRIVKVEPGAVATTEIKLPE
jgi:hypothetical protein